MNYSNNISHLSLKVNNLSKIIFDDEDYKIFDEIGEQEDKAYQLSVDIQRFDDFVKSQEQKEKPKTIYTKEELELKARFFSLVPDAHKQNIKTLVNKNCYGGDLIKYIRSRKLFSNVLQKN
ncbi:hypothetical protein WJ970_08605 [Achromobacter xylosoxidans]